MENGKLPAVLLAAGLSSRMGAFKPLLRLGGATLIENVIQSLQTSGAVGEIIVVTGHRAEEIRTAIATVNGLRLVVNPDFARGEMLSSVQKGIAALPPQSAGFVLAFADQPAVQAATIGLLAQHFFRSAAPLVLPTFGGKRGHPVVISAGLFPEIAALGAPDSLRTVIHRHLAAAQLAAVEDPSVTEDLDTPEDFARAAAKYNPPDLR